MKLRTHLEKDAELMRRAKGKRVLHLGCVGFTDSPLQEKLAYARQSLHQKLTSTSDCVGVDLDAESVRELQERGVFQNVQIGDVEKLDQMPELGHFDLVVAGDIIEHLSNPGKMLDAIHSRLKANGELIVSTPNSMGLPAYLRYATGRFKEGQQHVLCFNPITLEQLLRRHGYDVAEAFSCHQSRAQGIHGPLYRLGLAFLRCCPKFGGTLFFVARRRSDP